MSFMNKFKKEFEGLSIGERLQSQQAPSASAGAPGHPSSTPVPPYPYSAPPQPNYHLPPPGTSPYPNQYGDPRGQSYHRLGAPDYNAQQPQAPPSSWPDPAYPRPHYQQPVPSPDPAGRPLPHSAGAPVPQGGPTGVPAPCPVPPQWVPHWSGHDGKWYYVETTGRGCWDPPVHLAPLPAMPVFPGSMGVPGTQGLYSQGAQGYAGARPASHADPRESKRPSNTTLAAAGGFVAGGAAGYLAHEVLDKRKKKKRHGTTPADFSDFAEYPSMELDLQCNICDQTISGPYAHCAKCDRGDWDVCRDCLAQGATCDGKGKHRLVKVFPKYWCNCCDQLLRGDFYHCAICDGGDWDVCQRCLDRGQTCKADGGHQLVKLYIPAPQFKPGHSGTANTSSSSDEN